MEGKEIVKKVDVPDFAAIKGTEIGETICNLFAFLIPADMERPVDVDPRKIRLNYQDCRQLIALVQEEVGKNKELKVNLLWLNQGPAGAKDVPQGKIYLDEGYMKPATKKEQGG